MTEVVHLVQDYKDCRQEGKTILQCTQEAVVNEAVNIITEHSPIIRNTVISLDAVDYAQECQAKGNHNPVSCQIGAIVQTATQLAVDSVSSALAVGARTTKAWPIALAAATTGAINADAIGRDFGNLTVKLVDYLIEHVPAETIDSSSEIVLSNGGEHQLIFQPREVRLIQSFVRINQELKVNTELVRHEAINVIDKFEIYRQRLEGKIEHFNQISRHVEIKLGEQLDLVQRLEENRRRLRLEVPELERKLDTRYSDLNAEAFRHNQNPTRNSGAYVTCEDGNWTIGFKVTYGIGGGGGGGFSCALL